MSRVDDMPGYLAALAGVAIMTIVAWFMDVAPLTQTDAAICITDWPDWIHSSILSTLVGFLLIWLVSGLTTNVNRSFNVEEGTSALPASFFLIATTAIPAFLTGITPGMLMALACILSIRLMFACIDREQKAQPMFLVGTFMAFGSMVEYAFIPLAIAIMIAAATLDVLTVRSTLGYIIGIITPYVLVLGYGLVSPGDISIPYIYQLPMPTGVQIIAAATVALTAILLMLRGAVTPSNRSSRNLTLNRSLNGILFSLIVAMGVDFHNFTAYMPTAALLTGFGVASLAGNRNTSASPTLLIAILVVIFITLYIIAL